MEGMSNIVFPGWVDRAKIEALAQRSHAALAPYHNTDDFIITIPNKVIDALALGLPVLSPLSGEVGELIVKNDVGLIYGEFAGRSLVSCIQNLASKPDFQSTLSKNSKRLFQDRFSFEIVYGGLVRHLELLAKSVK
jgi:glycosyltransferase involved in cell wall biosynthesis